MGISSNNNNPCYNIREGEKQWVFTEHLCIEKASLNTTQGIPPFDSDLLTSVLKLYIMDKRLSETDSELSGLLLLSNRTEAGSGQLAKHTLWLLTYEISIHF